MLSDNIIGIIAGEIAIKQRDRVVNNIGDALKGALDEERIGKVRLQRILDNFIEGLKKI